MATIAVSCPRPVAQLSPIHTRLAWKLRFSLATDSQVRCANCTVNIWNGHLQQHPLQKVTSYQYTRPTITLALVQWYRLSLRINLPVPNSVSICYIGPSK